MYAPSFRLKCFETISDPNKFRVMHHLLEALIGANLAYLVDHPNTPPLYKAGVVYLAEPDGVDEWQDIPDTLDRRSGDCEDLACYRVAELRLWGVAAKPFVSVQILPDSRGKPVTTYHITVRHPDGQIEDPSRILGML